MENIIVILIVAVAAGFIGRSFYQKFFKKADSCGCGCSACDTDVISCDLPEAKEHLLSRTGQESEK